MSKYTTELRFICEKYAGMENSGGYNDLESILDKSWNKVFDFNFPIFDEEYRSVLCKKIIKHYYTREIGFESVGLWKLKLDMLMNEIMPYYNKLYETELFEFNPLYDADYTRTHEGQDTVDGTDTNTGTTSDSGTHGGTITDAGSHTGTIADVGSHTGTVADVGSLDSTIGDVGDTNFSETSWDAYSDTPQGSLTNVENDTYLTNARKIEHSSETDTTNDRTIDEDTTNTRTYNEATGNTRTHNESIGNTRTHNETMTNTRTDNSTLSKNYTNTDEYVDHVVGKFPGKTYMSLIKEFRENLLNIDVDVISDVGDLFIKLW